MSLPVTSALKPSSADATSLISVPSHKELGDADWQRWIDESTRDMVNQGVPQPAGYRRVMLWSRRQAETVFCVGSLVGLLAFVTALPVVQLVSLGYLLLVAGRLASGVPLNQSLPGLKIAGKIGMAVGAIALLSLPVGLLVHWSSVANIIDPGSSQAASLRFAAIASACVATLWLAWAWVRGGQLAHYVWPEPRRWLSQIWRWSTWLDASERLWMMAWSLQLPRLFWLGIRGWLGTLIWLLPAMLIMAVTRNGDPEAVGPIVALSLVALGWVLQYLPMLQTHFAAEGRWKAMFQWRQIRQDFAAAPWTWALSMLIGLVLMPIPLYLLKIEATPREITWLPCLVFVAFMLPARIAEGLALRRCRRKRAEAIAAVDQGQPARRSRAKRLLDLSSQWVVRLLVMPAIIVTYLAVLTASQFTSWDGVQTWIAQHALLVPVPFVGV
ncbi:MAG: DUF4013 domain-containing protein [Planctomycetota bacterium]